jgi:sugar phosphate permease
MIRAVEATVSPGFVLITKSWYLRSEHASRLGIWYSATGIFSIFSGLVNFGLSSIKNGSLPPWKVLYLFAGSFTIAFGLLFIALVPRDPETPPLVPIKGYNVFSSKQQAQLRQRVLGESGGSRNQQLPSVARWRKEEIVEALLDVKLHLFFLMAFAIYLVSASHALL